VITYITFFKDILKTAQLLLLSLKSAPLDEYY